MRIMAFRAAQILMTCIVAFGGTATRADDAANSSALEVMDAFMAAFNARDTQAWADTLLYPHVRFAGGTVTTFSDRDAFVAANHIDRLIAGEGWDHSKWDAIVGRAEFAGEGAHRGRVFAIPRRRHEIRKLSVVVHRRAGRWSVGHSGTVEFRPVVVHTRRCGRAMVRRRIRIRNARHSRRAGAGSDHWRYRHAVVSDVDVRAFRAGCASGLRLHAQRQPDTARIRRLCGESRRRTIWFCDGIGLGWYRDDHPSVVGGRSCVACDDMYGGTYRLFERVFKQQGIEFSYVDMTDPDDLAKAMRPNTLLVWLETPSNPLMKVVDIAKAAEIAHAHGALLAVDNTFMSPYFQRPIALGADIVMHSTTKYINGHSDLVGGVVITDDEELAERLSFLSNAIGGIQSTFDAYMCLRSLKTLAVRMQAHESNAQAVARFLEAHPKIAAVSYPGLPSHPQHALARKQTTGHGGMLTCSVAGDLAATRRFLQSVRVFALAESLGGVESLIEHPAIMTHASLPQTVRDSLGHWRQPRAVVRRHRSASRSAARSRPRARSGVRH